MNDLTLNQSSNDDDELLMAPGFSGNPIISQILAGTCSTSGNSELINDEMPCCSKPPLLVLLEEIFPDEEQVTLEECASIASDLNETVDLVIHKQDRENVLPTISLNHRHVFEVDEENILDDAFVYYKSTSFDPKKPLRIKFSGQTAIDVGGLLRQFYSIVSQKVENKFLRDIINTFFQKLMQIQSFQRCLW